jgi:hypothetical protein
MSQSTPINMIRRGETNLPPPMDPSLQHGGMGGGMDGLHSDSQLVEDILKEMGDSPGIENQSNINSQAFQHIMDKSQVPPNQYQPPPGAIPPNYQMENYNNVAGNSYNQKMMDNNQSIGFLSQMGINISGESLKDKIVKNIKYPIVVFVICFLISLPEFNRFLFGFCPRLLLESGQVSIGGVLLKSLIGMILFSIIVLFV